MAVFLHEVINRVERRRPNAKRLHPANYAWTSRRQTTVAVLGAGHGGMALAGYLAQESHRVTLWNRSADRLDPVTAQGGIRITTPGSAPTLASIALATGNMAAVVADARVIFVAVPASGHADVARACAPHLRDGQTVLLLPGRTGGAFEFRHVLRDADCRANVLLGEANSFPFAARAMGPAEATIYGTKAELLAAALPANRTEDLVAACRPYLPMLSAAPSVLHTGLANLGAILHPTITLLNAERIARGESFDFYTEGVTQRVADVLAAADEERLLVARAYGVEVQSLQEWIAAAYGHQADNLKETVGGNPAYVGIKAPNTLQHRYLLEDVPTGLIPMIKLGEASRLNLPTLRYLVDLAQKVLGGTLWQNPRTLESLGLSGLDAEEIGALVAADYQPAALTHHYPSLTASDGPRAALRWRSGSETAKPAA